MNMKQTLRKGYTLDQTILVVAIIAILVTIIIATVGWELITRAGGSKFASQLKQIEESSGQFFAEHQRWPTQTQLAVVTGIGLGQRPFHALAATPAIVGNPAFIANVCDGTSCDGIVKNMLPGMRFAADPTAFGVDAVHAFGSGDTSTDIMRMHQGVPHASKQLGTSTYILVNLGRVSRGEVLEADEAIDGELNGQTGRVTYVPAAATMVNNCAISTVVAPSADAQFLDVCYVANLIQ